MTTEGIFEMVAQNQLVIIPYQYHYIICLFFEEEIYRQILLARQPHIYWQPLVLPQQSYYYNYHCKYCSFISHHSGTNPRNNPYCWHGPGEYCALLLNTANAYHAERHKWLCHVRFHMTWLLYHVKLNHMALLAISCNLDPSNCNAKLLSLAWQAAL